METGELLEFGLEAFLLLQSVQIFLLTFLVFARFWGDR